MSGDRTGALGENTGDLGEEQGKGENTSSFLYFILFANVSSSFVNHNVSNRMFYSKWIYLPFVALFVTITYIFCHGFVNSVGVGKSREIWLLLWYQSGQAQLATLSKINKIKQNKINIPPLSLIVCQSGDEKSGGENNGQRLMPEDTGGQGEKQEKGEKNTYFLTFFFRNPSLSSIYISMFPILCCH